MGIGVGARCAGFVVGIGMIAGCGDDPAPVPVVAPPPSVVAPPPPEPPPSADRFASQLEALPIWGAEYEPEPIRMDQQPSTVPQLRDAASVLLGATDDARRGVLVCRVTVARDREWDSAGVFGRNIAPDVSVYLRLGGGTEVRARLPEDSYDAVLSVPAVDLGDDAEVTFRLVDRDISFDDPIAESTASFVPGRPMQLDAPPVTIRCGILDEARARVSADAALVRASGMLDLEERTRPRVDLLHDPLASPSRDTSRIRREIRDAASYVGYDDASVRTVRTRLEALEQGRGAPFDAAVAAALATARPPGTVVRIGRGASASITGFTCTPAATDRPPRCTLGAYVTYLAVPEPPALGTAMEAMLLVPGSAVRICQRVRPPDEAPLDSPRSRAESYDCPVDVVPGPGAVLARINLGSDAVLVRAR